MKSRDDIAEMLNYDQATGEFTWKRRPTGYVHEGMTAGHPSWGGYIRIGISGKKISAHKVAWLLVYGEWPNKQIDHIDGNKKNNAISNLRLATPSLNQLYNNQPRRGNTTGYVGVSPAGNRFKAQIRVGGDTKYLGQFATAELASDAYQAAKREAISVLAAQLTPPVSGAGIDTANT